MTEIPPHEDLTFSLPTTLDARLAQRAVHDRCSKTQIILQALDTYLAPQSPVELAVRSLEKTLQERLVALEARLVQLGHPTSPLTQTTPTPWGNLPEEDIEDEPDEILQSFLDP